jgi:hypothetical protein
MDMAAMMGLQNLTQQQPPMGEADPEAVGALIVEKVGLYDKENPYLNHQQGELPPDKIFPSSSVQPESPMGGMDMMSMMHPDDESAPQDIAENETNTDEGDEIKALLLERLRDQGAKSEKYQEGTADMNYMGQMPKRGYR